MPFTRRQLLRATLLLPAGAVAVGVAAAAGEAIRASVAALRPRPDGTSATRCGACGARDHTMLDPRCPAARKVI
jgi:hypothetical protein